MTAKQPQSDERPATSKRRLVKALTASAGALAAANMLPSQWIKPVVDTTMLPAHAQTSDRCPEFEFVSCSIDGNSGIGTLTNMDGGSLALNAVITSGMMAMLSNAFAQIQAVNGASIEMVRVMLMISGGDDGPTSESDMTDSSGIANDFMIMYNITVGQMVTLTYSFDPDGVCNPDICELVLNVVAEEN
ncbi:MAG: hypothetical protein WB783_20255 [Arenicellales bacterium]